MVSLDNDVVEIPPLEMTETNQVISQLRQEISSGLHWYLALLNAIGRWNITEETLEKRTYRYLIAEEAFDSMVLAERLCEAVADLLPVTEKKDFLFSGAAPLEIPRDEFKSRIGDTKYLQYLNFYYGITIEEALQYAVEEEIRKERRNSGLYRDKDNTPEVYRRIYGFTRSVLLNRFRKEKKYPQLKTIRLNEMKEFTYWLFKFRLKQSDKARVASDTKKGLDWLKRISATHRTSGCYQPGNLRTIDILNL